MGYAFNNVPAQLEMGSPTKDGITTISTAPGDIQLENIAVSTNLVGIGAEQVLKAFLDLYIPYMVNTSASVNKVGLSKYIKVKRTGAASGSYANAIYMPQDSLTIPASTSYSYGVIIGTVDISATIKDALNNSQSINVLWNQAQSAFDDLNIYCIQTKLRVVIY